MKRSHKINHGWFPPTPEIVIDDRYQTELDRARRKAERAHKNAERELVRAERMASRHPEPATIRARDEARLAVIARLEELQKLHDLMRDAPGTGGSRHSGRGAVSNVTSTRRLP